jgi:hypothetical protein
MVSVVLASAIAIGTLMVVTVIVTLMTGSILAAGVVVALIAIAYTVLVYYGFITVAVRGNEVDISVWDVINAASTPAPLPAMPEPPAAPLRGKEVYYVGDNRFNYDEAPAVCAAYGGDLATQEQVESAFSSGAEWCGYGWSAGGVALFPTQHATWELLQREVDVKKRTSCGRPGVNGGYFDPALKFGVNCYGVKPDGSAIFPQPPPGTDMKAFNDRVALFKTQLKDFFLAPFNRQTWAIASPTMAGYGTQFSQNIGGLAGSAGASTTPLPPTVSSGGSVGAPAASKSSANAPVGSPAGTAAPTQDSLQSVIDAQTEMWQEKITNGCMRVGPKPPNFSGNDGMPIDDTYALLNVLSGPQCAVQRSHRGFTEMEKYMKSHPQTDPMSQIMKPALKALLKFAPTTPVAPTPAAPSVLSTFLPQITPVAGVEVPEYSSSTVYRPGDMVAMGGLLYKMVEGAGSPGYAPNRPGDRLWQKV